jgi:hypothetical protein
MFAAVRLEVKQDQVLAEPGTSESELSQVFSAVLYSVAPEWWRVFLCFLSTSVSDQ